MVELNIFWKAVCNVMQYTRYRGEVSDTDAADDDQAAEQINAPDRDETLTPLLFVVFRA